MAEELSAEALAAKEVKDAVPPAKVEGQPNPDDPNAAAIDPAEQAEQAQRQKESSIQKLKRQREEARRESEFWKQEALKGRTAPAAAATAEPAAEPDGKPKPEAFKTVGEYFEALADWKAESKLAEHNKKAEAARVKEQESKHQESWKTREAEARTRYEDYDETLADDIVISRPMHALILESDVGPDVAYFLGKNPDEAARIAALPAMAAAREIGKIEAKFAKEEGKPGARSISKTPPPITPVNKATKAEVDPEKMTVKEWTEWRNKQIQAKRKRA